MSGTSTVKGYTDLFMGVLWRSPDGIFWMNDSQGALVHMNGMEGIFFNGKTGIVPANEFQFLKFLAYLEKNVTTQNILSTHYIKEGTCFVVLFDKIFETTPSFHKNPPHKIKGMRFFHDPKIAPVKREVEKVDDGSAAKQARVDVQAPKPDAAVVQAPVLGQPLMTTGRHVYADGRLDLNLVARTITFEGKTHALNYACLTYAGNVISPVLMNDPALSQAIDTLGIVKHSQRTNRVYYENAIPTRMILGRTDVERLEIHYNPAPIVPV